MFASLLLILAGCGPNFADDSAKGTDTEGTPAGTLRLDVTPPATEGAILLPQSHVIAPDNYEGLGLELFGTRYVSGVLTAQVARGYPQLLGAPTTSEPLLAGILALPEGDLQGAIAQSGEDGLFVLSFPAYATPIDVAIVPVDAGMAPVLVLAAPTSDTAGWNQEIVPGIPVYGRVTGEVEGVEQRLAGIPLRISRTIGGQVVSSAVFTTDRTGWYVARVDQLGDYTIEVEGGAPNASEQMAPALSVPVLVEAPEGIELPLVLGNVMAASVDGSVVDADGRRVPDARVRFTSVTLDSGIGSLEVETNTTEEGRFITDLLPGMYDIEIMPAYEAQVTTSPARFPRQRITDGVSLRNLELSRAARLTGRVVTVEEEPVADVQIVATEVGFGGHVYYASTGPDGGFDFPVTDVPLTITLTPAQSGDSAITTVNIEDPDDLGVVRLDVGVPVSGRLSHQGAEIAYASVDVYDAGSGVLLGRTVSDETGAFSLRISVPAPTETEETETDTGGDTADTDTDTDTSDTDTDTSDTDTSDTDTSDTDTSDT
ncbi:MAG: carboxypeptidase-like regulatory domain-containing protein, partial [Myxococcota bacterium]